MRSLILLLVLMFMMADPVYAQALAQPQYSQVGQDRLPRRDIDPNKLKKAALQVLSAFDRDQAGDIWEGASVIAKRAVSRDSFVAYVRQARESSSMPIERNWLSIRRQQIAERGEMPPGMYASIEFAAFFHNDRVRREIVSLRFDEDRKWRLAGYVVE